MKGAQFLRFILLGVFNFSFLFQGLCPNSKELYQEVMKHVMKKRCENQIALGTLFCNSCFTIH